MKKKLLVLSIAGFFTLPLFAQMTANAGRTTFGLRAGVNFNTFNGKDAADNNLENNISTGFHAGLNAEVPIGTGFYLQPGVLYSMKGAEYENGSQAKISYVEIPVNFVYKPTLGTGNMLLGFGPYVAFGIGGKIEDANGNERDVKFKNKINVDDDFTVSYLKKTDAGANLLAGYEFANKFSFQVNAQLGLVNINPEYSELPNDNSKLRNTGFGLSLGYRF